MVERTQPNETFTTPNQLAIDWNLPDLLGKQPVFNRMALANPLEQTSLIVDRLPAQDQANCQVRASLLSAMNNREHPIADVLRQIAQTQVEVTNGTLPKLQIDQASPITGKTAQKSDHEFGPDVLPSVDLQMINNVKKASGMSSTISAEMYRPLSDGGGMLSKQDRENSIIYKLEQGKVDPKLFNNAFELVGKTLDSVSGGGHGATPPVKTRETTDRSQNDRTGRDVEPPPAEKLHKDDRLKVQADGSGDVEVKRNDNLWNITKEVLKHNHPEGYQPSVKEIADALKKVIHANPQITNPNLIHPGDHVHIPKDIIKDAPKEVPHKEPEKQKHHIQVENHGASKEFQEKIQKQVDALPEGVRKLLEANGTKIVVGGKVSDVKPELKGVRPRGWPPGTTWDNAEGLYSPNDKSVIVTETKIQDGKVVPDTRAQGVANHEIGHAVDHAMGDYSHSAEFKEAYEKDVAKLSPADRQKLAYLLQNGDAGKEETFGEVFAALQGATCNSADTQYILEKFPNLAALLKRKEAAM